MHVPELGINTYRTINEALSAHKALFQGVWECREYSWSAFTQIGGRAYSKEASAMIKLSAESLGALAAGLPKARTSSQRRQTCWIPTMSAALPIAPVMPRRDKVTSRLHR